MTRSLRVGARMAEKGIFEDGTSEKTNNLLFGGLKRVFGNSI